MQGLLEGLWLQTSLDSIKYTHGSYTDKSVIYFIPTSGGGCGYKWNPVVSALCRFCPGSFLPNLVGHFGLIFSKYPWVRYDRSKKNVTPTPTLPCLIRLSSSVEPNCIFTTPTRVRRNTGTHQNTGTHLNLPERTINIVFPLLMCGFMTLLLFVCHL